MIVLGIETSCDETATAVCHNGTIQSSKISSQDIHIPYGGVVPELASREHERLLNTLVERALNEAGITRTELEGIAVTQGPGLAGTLLTGVCFAKGFAQGLKIPVIGVNHLEAHIFANFLADPTLEYPFVSLLVSGGHTQLWHVKARGDYSRLGETRDDAAGEAFDKGARILGLGYPGGPEIQNLAQNGNHDAVDFPRSFLQSDQLEFSFSGLKTSLLYYMDTYNPEADAVSLADIAASYQKAIVETLAVKLSQAVRRTHVNTCLVAGGVAANRSLRKMVRDRLPDNVRVLYPDIEYCTDNAAMVAFLGELKLQAGDQSPLSFNIEPNLTLTVD